MAGTGNDWGSTWPLLENLHLVFPPSIRTVICGKGEQRAAVQTRFTGPERSELVVEVKAAEVRTVAMQLFAVNIHVRDNSRYLMLETGSGILSKTYRLFSASMDNVERYLGEMISERLSDSLARKNELKHGDPLTSLVSMEFEERDDSPGRVRIIMGGTQLRLIEDQLFPAI